jgi:glycosyltransferase involved in cell wall biosynthesis
MRVLFFNEGNLGTHILGQGRFDAAVLAGLPAAPDVEARFAGLAPLGRWASALASFPVPGLGRVGLDFRTARWHVVQSLRARTRLAAELREWPADVLHVHTQSVALAIPRIMRTLPVVLSVDATVRDWAAMPAWSGHRGGLEAAPSRALERRALKRAALVLAWTRWACRGVERDAPEANVVEHHPGIDLERYRPAARSERAMPRVLFVGGRFQEKGGEDLLDALGSDLGRTVELDLVTPDPVPERPGVRMHRLTVTDPKLLELQQQADLMCLPTYGDTNPWALLEAMACGTPVVSTPVGGIPDMLEDGRAGVLVPHGDPRALGEALRGLLADPARREQLSAAARERCARHYDARRQFAALAERLRELAPPLRRPTRGRSARADPQDRPREARTGAPDRPDRP